MGYITAQILDFQNEPALEILNKVDEMQDSQKIEWMLERTGKLFKEKNVERRQELLNELNNELADSELSEGDEPDLSAFYEVDLSDEEEEMSSYDEKKGAPNFFKEKHEKKSNPASETLKTPRSKKP